MLSASAAAAARKRQQDKPAASGRVSEVPIKACNMPAGSKPLDPDDDRIRDDFFSLLSSGYGLLTVLHQFNKIEKAVQMYRQDSGKGGGSLSAATTQIGAAKARHEAIVAMSGGHAVNFVMLDASAKARAWLKRTRGWQDLVDRIGWPPFRYHEVHELAEVVEREKKLTRFSVSSDFSNREAMVKAKVSKESDNPSAPKQGPGRVGKPVKWRHEPNGDSLRLPTLKSGCGSQLPLPTSCTLTPPIG
ncbi:uncharacterized protein IWZ02DRAFT_494718 [Phyllosticta citriasiana]|uniref:uncharacterized protein n=1 Tax=Phyllosticta citriasiana TaxID=595635 RepID=UPI0030FD4552